MCHLYILILVGRNKTIDEAGHVRQVKSLSTFNTHTLWSCYVVEEFVKHCWTPVSSQRCVVPRGVCLQFCGGLS